MKRLLFGLLFLVSSDVFAMSRNLPAYLCTLDVVPIARQYSGWGATEQEARENAYRDCCETLGRTAANYCENWYYHYESVNCWNRDGRATSDDLPGWRGPGCETCQPVRKYEPGKKDEAVERTPIGGPVRIEPEQGVPPVRVEPVQR